MSGLDKWTETAPEIPKFSDRMKDDPSDAVDFAENWDTDVFSGLLSAGGGLVQFVRQIDPTNPYNLTHPAQYLQSMTDLYAGMVVAGSDPGATVSAMFKGAADDPGHAVGNLAGQVLIGLATGGGSVAETTVASVTTDVAEVTATTVVKDGVETGVQTAAKDVPGLEAPALQPKPEVPIKPDAPVEPAAPAGTEPAATGPKSDGPAAPDTPAGTQTGDRPADVPKSEPEQPAAPEQSNAPVRPDQPAAPEHPGRTEQPAAQEQQAAPEQSAAQDHPAAPEQPATPERPATPEQAGAPEHPVSPEHPAAPDKPTGSDPAAPSEAAPQHPGETPAGGPASPENPATTPPGDAARDTGNPADHDPGSHDNLDPQQRNDADTPLHNDATDSPAERSQQPEQSTLSEDPVDIATGEFLLPATDIDLPDVLPLRLRRRYRSNFTYGRWFGPAWSCTFDARVVVEHEGVTFLSQDGVLLAYPHAPVGEPVEPVTGGQSWMLTRTETSGHQVSDRDRELVWHFAPEPGLAGIDSRLGNYAISAITDRRHNRIRFHYNSNGDPTEVTHSGGYRVLITTNLGRITLSRGSGHTLQPSQLPTVAASPAACFTPMTADRSPPRRTHPQAP